MPLYQQVADSLRERVLEGTWQPGAALPTERELCERFAASRITIRRALQILADELIIERRQGSGTFVSEAPRRRIPILNRDFAGSMRRHAPELKRRLIHRQWTGAGDQAQRLGLRPNDQVLYALRVDDSRHEPVAMDQLWIPQRFADALDDADLARIDFMRLWQRRQRLDLRYATQTLEADGAAAPVTTHLKIRRGKPILRETDLLYVAGHVVAGLFITAYRHDVFRFDVTKPYHPTPRSATG